MFGHALVWKTVGGLYVRFERITSEERFQAILDEFRYAFPIAYWDPLQKGWRLPPSKLKHLRSFCDEMIGPNSMREPSFAPDYSSFCPNREEVPM
ncbi:MAG: hypothetical protein Kow00120_12470 [Anaerolineae bacterium]